MGAVADAVGVLLGDHSVKAGVVDHVMHGRVEEHVGVVPVTRERTSVVVLGVQVFQFSFKRFMVIDHPSTLDLANRVLTVL